MIRNVAFVDTETTGLDPSKDVVIEIGCVLWSVEHKSIIECWSSLVYHEDHPTNEAESVNCIPAASLPLGVSFERAVDTLRGLVSRADVIIAHRAEFDSSFLPDLGKPWVCSKFDMAFPNAKVGDGLVHIALANGVGVTHAHRALTDCLTLARVFERVADSYETIDIESMIENAMRPKVKVQALVSYDERHKARDAGFSWDPQSKAWTRRMPREEVSALPFKTREIAA